MEEARVHGEDLLALHGGRVLSRVERVQDGGGDGDEGRVRPAVWGQPEPAARDGRQGAEGVKEEKERFRLLLFYDFGEREGVW